MYGILSVGNGRMGKGIPGGGKAWAKVQRLGQIRRVPGIVPLGILATEKWIVNNKIKWVDCMWNIERSSTAD